MSSLHRWLVMPLALVMLLGTLALSGCAFIQDTLGTGSSDSADASADASQAAETDADGEATEAEAETAAAEEEEEIVYEPKEGMTKEEIVEMYRGEPDRRSVGSDGTEVWTYHVNAGEAWIPFNYGYRPRFHQIHFNSDGVVESYTVDE